MTDAELMALAKTEALKTTITPTEFIARCKSGGYDHRQAHWFKAMQALEQLKHSAPNPPPPPTPTPYGTRVDAGAFAGRGIMLGSNRDVWGQAFDLAKAGHVETVAATPSTEVAVKALFGAHARVVSWAPPEQAHGATVDIAQAESKTEWDTMSHAARGFCVNSWEYGRFDNTVALVEAYFNEGWGVDFNIYAHYTDQGARAVIPVCGGYHANGRSDQESARLYQSLGSLPFPGFWVYCGESLMTPETEEVLKAWRP